MQSWALPYLSPHLRSSVPADPQTSSPILEDFVMKVSEVEAEFHLRILEVQEEFRGRISDLLSSNE
ncbi:hypothetical protein E2C01_036079 [Portunus trituberculatus]|uniref:Uncharacterized protein n=1 Tax=Portunus trituberculatus TaxID=210409 RepID=A0A5B7FA89_PORTR|nr:hypothetical protein [Portunus trituberculatus]